VRIVDAHLHLGDCCIVDAEVGEEELSSALDANGVDLAPVMHVSRGLRSGDGHNAISELGRRTGRTRDG
jgi:hypothetical protein